MAFWRFGFHSRSAIDTILSSSAANNNGHPIGGCSTPSSSNPSILLDKLLDEDDLLQEIKAQHHKLIEFLATKEVVVRMLGYISGLIFDDEDSDRLEEETRSAIRNLTFQPSSPLDSRHSSTAGHHNDTMGGAIFHSFRNHTVGDKFSALLLDALDSEGRTPEDRAKNERRKVRFPYICSEIIASEIWNVTSQIFADAPHYAILTGFWDAVLNQPPSVTAHKSIQIGHWARTNMVLFNSKPNEMIRFVLSYPGLIPKLLSHFNLSPVVDVLLKIIQCEAVHEGIIDWLIDSTDFVELIINFLHPSRPVELHIAVADFLKNVIGFCTTKATSPQSPADQSSKPSASAHSPILPHQSSQSHPPINSLNALHSPSAHTLSGSGVSEDGKFITTRLMRELASSSVVSKLLSFGLDTEMPEDESLITKESINSSLVNSLSILIDLIRRNNSDFSEAQILIHFRKNVTGTSQSDEANLSSLSPIQDPQNEIPPSPAPAIVALMDLLDCISDRLPDLQQLIRTPTSSIRPIRTSVGTIVPLTLERFRVIELYAELLHCSNMSMLNRPKSSGPVYDQNGHLISGLEDLIAVVCPAPVQSTPTETPLEESDVPSLELTGAEKKNETESTVESAVDGGQGTDQNTTPAKNSDKEVSIDATDSASSPENSTHLSSDDEAPSGMRLKRRFIEHKVLDTCLDLFFDFPWNNFLHNVVFDIIQQILNGHFFGPGGEASLELSKSLFDSSRIIERILEGIEINQTYGLMSNNVRLGNMAHLILIADEISKALELQPETFVDISRRIESNAKWQHFVDTAVKEARFNSHTPLGGSVPQRGLSQPTPSSDKSLVIDGETFPTNSGSEGQRDPKVGWSIKSPTLTNSTNLPDQDENKDDDDEKGSESEEPSHRDQNDDDPWSTGRPLNTRTNSSGSGGSVISNPTPFGFDDRFDAPSRSFPTRFGAGTEEDDEDEIGGFGDDFGPFSDSAAIHHAPIYDPFTLTSPSFATPKPLRASVQNDTEAFSAGPSSISWDTSSHGMQKIRTHDSAGEGDGAGFGDDDDDWGEFSGAASETRLTPTEQDAWTDFDLGVGETVELPKTEQKVQIVGNRSRAGSASSPQERFGPGVDALCVQAIRDDGKVEVKVGDGSVVTVPKDEVMNAVMTHSNV